MNDSAGDNELGNPTNESNAVPAAGNQAQVTGAHHENPLVTRRIKEALSSHYDAAIAEVQAEINEIESALAKSGPARAAWLKATRRLSEDPHRDLNLLNSMREIQERRRDEELTAEEERAARFQAGSSHSPADARSTPRGPRMSRADALHMVELLEDNLQRPSPELLALAGRKPVSEKAQSVRVKSWLPEAVNDDFKSCGEDAQALELDLDEDFDWPF